MNELAMNESDTRDRVLKTMLSSQSALLAYAHSMLQDYSAAEDVVQNVFLIVARKYEDFEEGTSIVAWCRPMVRFEVLKYLRNSKREQTVEDRVLQNAMDAAFDEQQTDDLNFRMEYLRNCLAKLPSKRRELLRLRYQDQAGYLSIAEALGISLETVRKSLFRARHSLRNCVDLHIQREVSP
ncbi:RNA polymerase sigma-70 factor, Rhodopirellula/Verrucomicrobium family [Neorhodopirellula lusitana]|uniref:RNA polymerase sigma-70 factor, Rhodopirellula/Verrucomicrobium family n=1 Tax=Neorhodopirellula lusitana TaxID=445327 RepID=A0ABY1QKG0_9BACT|nr:sigma-70 family RNA polymerase sigma factor [Neorhodopirellula lusitana]SMP73367.1 RNA polymerase sigma-70 factor, Rhodopirellula/Verrucomicrobium family [Neorhodopirellula lusitana]